MMFRPWKVRAIAASPDKLWQTRRAFRIQPGPGNDEFVHVCKPPTLCVGKYPALCASWPGESEFDTYEVKPRYHPGEVVYIKEAWTDFWRSKRDIGNIAYKLDLPSGVEVDKWRSPLFMPAWAARYFIKILKVKACRTIDINFEDCLAEGVVDSPQWQELMQSSNYKPPSPLNPNDLSNEAADREIERGWIEYARQAYFALYDSINGKASHEHDWVWCYQFVKTARPEAER